MLKIDNAKMNEAIEKLKFDSRIYNCVESGNPDFGFLPKNRNL